MRALKIFQFLLERSFKSLVIISQRVSFSLSLVFTLSSVYYISHKTVHNLCNCTSSSFLCSSLIFSTLIFFLLPFVKRQRAFYFNCRKYKKVRLKNRPLFYIIIVIIFSFHFVDSPMHVVNVGAKNVNLFRHLLCIK